MMEWRKGIAPFVGDENSLYEADKAGKTVLFGGAARHP